MKKTIGTTETFFVYDAAGRVVAEYGNESQATAGTSYITQDMLGSTRVVTGSNPSDERGRYDYRPFGEEIYNGRTGYGGQNDIKQRFTGKERDETGLDYFNARAYDSARGRFTSTDPALQSGNAINPQSWNRYTYTLNNPLNSVDANGMWPTWIHNLITANALPGLGAADLRQIQGENFGVDFPTTVLPQYAHEHAMTREGESTETAIAKMNSFIRENDTSARSMQQGNSTTFDQQALGAFGRSDHSVQDNTSPAHRGFQVYFLPRLGGVGGVTPMDLIVWAAIYNEEMKAHKAIENSINPLSPVWLQVCYGSRAQHASLSSCPRRGDTRSH